MCKRACATTEIVGANVGNYKKDPQLPINNLDLIQKWRAPKIFLTKQRWSVAKRRIKVYIINIIHIGCRIYTIYSDSFISLF